MKFHNRRKFQRISFDGQASLDFMKGSYECCQIQNLSLTGLFVTGTFLRQNKKHCFLRIFHNDKTENNSLLATAKVVWSNNEGVGLEFTNMTLENYELLQETLSKNTEQPENILREIPHIYPFEITSV